MNIENDFLDWDDEILDDGEFTLLEAGDYDFEVTSFERSYTKKDNAPMAVLKLKVTDDGGASTTITERIVLKRSAEWKLSQFFRSIGQKKHGEKLKMDWNRVLGATGRCEIEVDTYTANNGKEQKNNRVKRFYDYDETKTATPEPEDW